MDAFRKSLEDVSTSKKRPARTVARPRRGKVTKIVARKRAS